MTIPHRSLIDVDINLGYYSYLLESKGRAACHETFSVDDVSYSVS